MTRLYVDRPELERYNAGVKAAVEANRRRELRECLLEAWHAGIGKREPR